MRTADSKTIKKMNRRTFFKYGLRLALLALLGIGFEARNNLRIEKVDLRFQNLPRSFRDFKIIQISDLHASFWVTTHYLQAVVEAINRLEKDLVVITGDIITGAVNDFWKRWLPTGGRDYVDTVVRVLAGLHRGPKMAVLGNHDHWDGKATEKKLVQGLESAGIQVLRNRSETISRGQDQIHIAGTDDIWFSYNIDRALEKIPPRAFKILLSHSPDVVDDLDTHKRIDLTLCGHTHGGQVAIPYLSHHFIPINHPNRYLAGLVKEPYGYTYVNRGIGTLVFPFRFNAPPEITSLTLQ
jgi:predicted MPP superfamily phosphohydrolase